MKKADFEKIEYYDTKIDMKKVMSKEIGDAVKRHNERQKKKKSK
tara:strand:- start:238 stop:369 length:132 start_codon:yes stop_codon:yes gene_type:complete